MTSLHPLYFDPGRAPASGAFTILELMIVVAIIGLLAVLAVPAFVKQRMQTQDTIFLNNLRIMSAALEQYAIENGDYPADADPGVEPPGFSGYMPVHFHWEDEPRIGGRWDWNRAVDRTSKIFGVYAGISVLNPHRTSIQMADIDARIDDGEINSGRFRRHDGGYIYVSQE